MARKDTIAEVPSENAAVRSDIHISIDVADGGTKKETSPIGASAGSSIATVRFPGRKSFYVVDDPEVDALHRRLAEKARVEAEEDDEQR